MTPIRFILTLTLVVGCSASHGVPPDRCAATRTCFDVDSLGCCLGGGTEVSVCDVCPDVTMDLRSCRASGCSDPCGSTGGGEETPAGPPGDADIRPRDPSGGAPIPMPTCFEDLGGGCCGDVASSPSSCGFCPAGTVSEYACADFAPSCGCSTAYDPPATADAGTSTDRDRVECYQDFGGGCCGELVGPATACGCPAGSVDVATCAGFATGGVARPMMPPPDGGVGDPLFGTCFEVLPGSGCCGAPVARDVCSGACPAGSVEPWSCGADPICLPPPMAG